ncbi:MAG: FAD-dependent oxidoreductase, partial [Planctomycetaceae bacterium]
MNRVELDLRRRYLIPFHTKKTPHVFTDVLVIGGGIAGIRAAMAASEKQQVLLVTKDTLQQSNSAYAQGGIAGVLDPLDDVAHHMADTMSAGKGLCDASVVRAVCSEAPAQIRELIDFGAQFDLDNGELELTQEGGHSRRRVAHALGDATGKEIMRALVSRIRTNASIQIWEQTFTI